jgi:hypothetical protein
VYLEAAATGLPVVAARSGGVEDAVEDGVTGVLVPRRDPAALADALAALLAEPERAAALGRAGRLRVEREFTPAALGERMAEVYREAVAAPAASRTPPAEVAWVRPRAGRVSVFVPSWRCREWLPRAVESAVAQGWPDVEVCVVADDCDDVDDELLRRFPTVAFARTNRQTGPYGIANLLLAATRGDFVAFQDADDWSTPDRVEIQVDHLQVMRYDGCGSWALSVDVHGDPVGFETYPEEPTLELREALGHPILHPTVVYRRPALERAGGFDAGTRFGADTEFFYRTCTTLELGNVPRFLYRRTVRPQALTQTRETGFGSPARTVYLDRITEAAAAVLRGAAPPAAPGHTLLGTPLQPDPAPTLHWLRPPSAP